MKRILFSLILLLLGISCLQAQILTGKVVDSKTLAPLSEVSVYLNGTSINTTTDDDGMFTLSMNRVISTDLVVTRVGYATAYISNPFHQSLDTILLVEKENELDEISVFPDKMKRNRKLKMFKNSFFGKTKGGKSCVIHNEEDIELYFNSRTNTLTAQSDSPLIIENKHLGYKVYFNLINFQTEFAGDPLLLVEKRSSIRGTSLFEDIKPNENKYIKRREETYIASRKYFLKHFANSTFTDVGYIIETAKKEQIVDLNKYFNIKDSISVKKISILSKDGLPLSSNGSANSSLEAGIFDSVGDEDSGVCGSIKVIDRKKNISTIKFRRCVFWIDAYGNLLPLDELGNVGVISSLSFSGFLGDRRVGNILPLDYEP